jgi:hypothetical protein
MFIASQSSSSTADKLALLMETCCGGRGPSDLLVTIFVFGDVYIDVCTSISLVFKSVYFL